MGGTTQESTSFLSRDCVILFPIAGVNILSNDKIRKNAFVIRLGGVSAPCMCVLCMYMVCVYVCAYVRVCICNVCVCVCVRAYVCANSVRASLLIGLFHEI